MKGEKGARYEFFALDNRYGFGVNVALVLDWCDSKGKGKGRTGLPGLLPEYSVSRLVRMALESCRFPA